MFSLLFTKRQNFGLVQIESVSDNKLIVTKMIISVFDRVEKIVTKEKLLVTQVFQIPSFPDPYKGVIVWESVEVSLEDLARNNFKFYWHQFFPNPFFSSVSSKQPILVSG